MTNNWINALERNLNDKSLVEPRHAARRAYSPELSYGRHFCEPPAHAKLASVLVLLEAQQDSYCIPLTVRPKHLPDHPGQISLPGGRREPPESLWDAAKREFHEELGVPFAGRMLGQLLPLYVFNSNYYVFPFVAVCDSELDYSPCQHEVDRVVQLPIEDLLASERHKTATFRRGRLDWKAPVIPYRTDQIWGATAIMLGELSYVIRRAENAFR